MQQQGTEARPAKRFTLSGSVELILSAAAPITVVTALLVHVGWVRSQAYYGYFGVDQNLLRPSVQDYVLRSVDVTFGVVVRLVAVGLVFILLERIFVHLLRNRGPGGDRITGALVVLGVLLSAVGLFSALGFLGGLGIPPLFAAAILAVGVGVVLRLGPSLFANTGASLGTPTTAALYVVLVVALFWAATLYAQDLGQRSARATDTNPAGLPVVTVFSEKYLDLPGTQVRATQISGADGHMYYRYSGMSLLTYSEGTWFLTSGRYSNGYRSSVLMLRDSAGIRIEVAAPVH